MKSIFNADAGAVSDYILKGQREEDDPVVFELKTLTTREFKTVMDHWRGVTDDSMVSIPAGALYQAFSLGLIGWRNATDENGKEVPFSKAQKEKIGFDIMVEIGNEVIDRSRVNRELVKN